MKVLRCVHLCVWVWTDEEPLREHKVGGGESDEEDEREPA